MPKRELSSRGFSTFRAVALSSMMTIMVTSNEGEGALLMSCRGYVHICLTQGSQKSQIAPTNTLQLFLCPDVVDKPLDCRIHTTSPIVLY